MNIEQNTAVTLRYKVSAASRRVLDDGADPMVYLHGGYGNTFARIEAALEGQTKGYQTVVELQPQDAFGERDESLVQTIPKSEFPPGVKVGGMLKGRDDAGHERQFTVVKIKGDKVMLDGNHPMAGKALRFALAVTDVRAASAVEIEHGHVHGEHGHHH
jgi:FKBP-type peptidyl-prolyl cis-trans isomerase SlyD